MTKHIREICRLGHRKRQPARTPQGHRCRRAGLCSPSVFCRPRAGAADDAPKWGADGMPHGTVNNPHAFVSIAPDGTVTIVCHRSEMGQGVRTGMPLIVADELEADWARVKIAQAPGDEVKYGNQDTDGSRSTRHFMHADAPMRRRRAHDAGSGRGETLGRSGHRRRGEEPRGRPEVHRARNSAMASSPPTPARWAFRRPSASKRRAPRRPSVCLSRIPRSSATSARKAPTLSTASTSRPVAPFMARTFACPGMKFAVVARPPVMGGKVDLLRRHGCEEGAGRRQNRGDPDAVLSR